MSTTTSTTLPAGLTAGVWTVDASHTEASFSVRHAGISKVRGTVGVTEGTITVGDDLEATAVNVTLDPSTVTTGDANRDGHLKSGDFFDVENHPTMTFKSTGITADGGDFLLTGDLSLHGVTKSVTFELEFEGVTQDPWGNTRAGFSAKTEINRKDWGLEWNAPLEAGGVLIGEKVKIDLEIEAVKAA